MSRIDIKTLLQDPEKRRALLVDAGIALQHMAGHDTTQAQMEAAYDHVQADVESMECPNCGLRSAWSGWDQTCGRCYVATGTDYVMIHRSR